mgnify:CR=1 FL=1|jgi:hypothetical protein
MNTSEAIDLVSAAISAAQGTMKPAEMGATNPHFRSKYADLASVIHAIRDPLAKNGLGVLQDVQTVADEGGAFIGVSVLTRILHKSGQWIELGPLTIPLAKVDAHGLGAAVTYSKRYAVVAALGVSGSDIDDDGNAAITIGSRVTAKKPALVTDAALDEAMDRLRKVAPSGTAKLRAAWKVTTNPTRARIKGERNDAYEALQVDALQADEGLTHDA